MTVRELVELPWLDEPEFTCFGCSPRNPFGLALKFYRTSDGDLATDLRFEPRFQSYPGVVHGGMVGVALDELMGDMLAIEYGMLAFSITLRTKFLLPLAVDTRYRAVARVTRKGAGIVGTEAEVTDEAGEMYAMATGTYQPITSAQAEGHMGLAVNDRQGLAHYFDHTIG